MNKRRGWKEREKEVLQITASRNARKLTREVNNDEAKI
jgi:hypothetical protein